MSKAEWLKIATELQARWPHKPIPQESIAIWFDDLRDLEHAQVRTAVLAIYRDGREWAPNGAQIRAKVVDLTRDDPSEGEAWQIAMTACKRFGASIPQNIEDAMAWIAVSSPAVLFAVQRFGYRDLCLTENLDTARAQFRDIYRAVRSRRDRDARYIGLPAAGMKGLESGPRTIGEITRESIA